MRLCKMTPIKGKGKKKSTSGKGISFPNAWGHISFILCNISVFSFATCWTKVHSIIVAFQRWVIHLIFKILKWLYFLLLYFE